MKMRLLILSALMATGAAMAETVVPTVDEAGTGFWMARFSTATNYAWQTKTPLVLFWANSNCTECAKLEASVTNAAFTAWMKTNQYAFCFVEGRAPSSRSKDWDCGINALSGANEFARSAAGTITLERKKLSSFPYICLYWPQTDGTFKVRNFTGRDGTMGGGTGALDAQLRTAVSAFFAGYVGVRFADTGSVWDRYEAEPGLTTNVPVCVKAASGRTGLSLRAHYPFAAEDAVSPLTFNDEGLAWADVPIPPKCTSELLGSNIVLTVTDEAGSSLAQSSIVFYHPENSSGNPLWVTERTSDTLQFGEWTADMDAATQKVARAAGSAWTLVELAGSLWCPDCYRTEVNFLADGTKVHDWAVANNVALVSVDTPHNSAASPDLTVGTIWNREADQTKLIIDGANADKEKVTRSGKGYLSRKMVSDAAAAVVAKRNLWYSREYFHRPEDYATHRTLIPLFVLLDAGGKIVGRFETFDARSQSPQTSDHTSAYLQRFSEMIEMAGCSDSVVDDNHWSTTKRVLAANEGSVTEYLSHSDYQDVWMLSSVKEGQKVNVRVGGVGSTDGRRLHSEILLVDASGQSTVVASGEGTLSAGFDCTCEVKKSGSYYARVFCRPGDDNVPTSDAGFGSTEAGSTLAHYEITYSSYVVPQETLTTVAAGQAVQLSPDQTYWFSGECDFTANGCLESIEGQADLYHSRVDRATNVVFDTEHEYSCRLWTPGRIAFVQTTGTFTERDGGGALEVVRKGGSSGEAFVIVEVTNEVNVAGRYSLSPTVLRWEDGETDAKAVWLTVRDDGVVQGLGSLTLKLRPVDGCLAEVSADEALSVTITDSDKPALRQSNYVVTNYLGVASSCTFEVLNVAAGSAKIVRSSASDRVPSGLSLSYDKAAGAVVLEGTAKRAGVAVLEVALKQGSSTGPTSSLTIVTVDPSSVNPFMGRSRASTVRALVDESGAAKKIVGTLTVAITASGKLTAKYQGIEVKNLSMTGNWCRFDESTGCAECEMQKNDVSLLLMLDPEGYLTAELTYGALCRPETYTAVFEPTGASDFSAFAGYYTVALPVLGRDSEDAPSGAGYVTLTMTNVRDIQLGKMKYAGVMSDGAAVSGVVYLRRNGENACADIFCRKNKDLVGLPIELSPNGKDLWCSLQSVADREVVNLPSGYEGYLQHQEAGHNYELSLDVCGCWYPQGSQIGSVVEEFYGTSDQPFDVTLDAVANVGTLAYQGRKFAVTASSNGLSLSVADKTGVFKGRAKLEIDSSLVPGKIYGVVTPGWRDNCGCGQPPKEIPFGNGTFVFSHKVSGKTVVDSIPVSIEAQE